MKGRQGPRRLQGTGNTIISPIDGRNRLPHELCEESRFEIQRHVKIAIT